MDAEGIMITKRSFHYGKYGTVTARLVIKQDEASSALELVRRHSGLLEEYFDSELSRTADEYGVTGSRRMGRRTARPFVLTAVYRFADGVRPMLYVTVTLLSGTVALYEKNECHAYVKYGGKLYYKGEKRHGKYTGNMKNVSTNG